MKVDVQQNIYYRWTVAILATAGTYILIRSFLFAGVTSFLFSWLLHFALMAWFTVVASQVKPALASPYFKTYTFEKEGKIYEALGVHLYRRLLVLSGWEKISQKENPVNKDLAALQKYDYATRSSETGHAVIALMVLGVTVWVVRVYGITGAFWLILLNILFNFYPIMVQRYNRPRIRRVLHKYFSQTKNPTLSRL